MNETSTVKVVLWRESTGSVLRFEVKSNRANEEIEPYLRSGWKLAS